MNEECDTVEFRFEEWIVVVDDEWSVFGLGIRLMELIEELIESIGLGVDLIGLRISSRVDLIGSRVEVEVEVEMGVIIEVILLTNEIIDDSIEWLDESKVGFIVEIEDTVGMTLSKLEFNESRKIEESETVSDVEFPFRNSEEETVGKKPFGDKAEYSPSITVELKS